MISSWRWNYLGIKLSKKEKYLDSENYRILMKENKDDTNGWRDIPCSWIWRINILKIVHYSKQSIELMQSLSNYQRYFSQNRTKKIVETRTLLNTICCYLVTKSCLTLGDPMKSSMPGFPVFHYPPEFAQALTLHLSQF